MSDQLTARTAEEREAVSALLALLRGRLGEEPRFFGEVGVTLKFQGGKLKHLEEHYTDSRKRERDIEVHQFTHSRAF